MSKKGWLKICVACQCAMEEKPLCILPNHGQHLQHPQEFVREVVPREPRADFEAALRKAMGGSMESVMAVYERQVVCHTRNIRRAVLGYGHLRMPLCMLY